MWREPIQPTQFKLRGKQLLAGGIKRAAVLDVMTHGLTDALTSWLAGVGWYQADALHHRRPFFIVVSTAARFAGVLLQLVNHFMHKRGKRVAYRADREIDRIHGDFINDLSG